MADEPIKWHDLFVAILDHPEKGALLLVLLAGCWRWIRELFHEVKDDRHHETFVDSLLQRIHEMEEENKELREELRKLNKSKHDD